MAKEQTYGYDMNVSLDLCAEGGHATFKRKDGRVLEIMLSAESVAYLGAILDVSIDHSCVLLGNTKDFFTDATDAH